MAKRGEKKLVAGHDLNYLAESGLLSLSTSKNGEPILPNVQIADIAGGELSCIHEYCTGFI